MKSKYVGRELTQCVLDMVQERLGAFANGTQLVMHNPQTGKSITVPVIQFVILEEQLAQKVKEFINDQRGKGFDYGEARNN